jgi:cellobiose-specific phosphotransferase system component IIC
MHSMAMPVLSRDCNAALFPCPAVLNPAVLIPAVPCCAVMCRVQWMTHHIIPMHVLAELVVHSYPYKADIHMTLQVSGLDACRA